MAVNAGYDEAKNYLPCEEHCSQKGKIDKPIIYFSGKGKIDKPIIYLYPKEC